MKKYTSIWHLKEKRLKDIKLEVMYVDVIKKREEGSMTAYKDYAQNRKYQLQGVPIKPTP